MGELLRQGHVRGDHADLKVDPCGLLKQNEFVHSLGLRTAYETCNGCEAEYTNYTESFKGTLDYIWYTRNSLSVLAVSQVDDEIQLSQETALPSSTRPSDHVSLVATFMFREHDGNAREQSSPGRHDIRSAAQAGLGPPLSVTHPFHAPGAAFGG